jgi:hypothetical protein
LNIGLVMVNPNQTTGKTTFKNIVNSKKTILNYIVGSFRRF